MDQGEEPDRQPSARLVLPRQWMGFPWFAWLAAAIYLFILFNLFSPYL